MLMLTEECPGSGLRMPIMKEPSMFTGSARKSAEVPEVPKNLLCSSMTMRR